MSVAILEISTDSNLNWRISMNIYCTYLTLYSGNKLPPFYIGHTSIQKVENGYHGSVASQLYKPIWDIEQKENPQLFKTVIISKHPTRKEAIDKELKLQTKLNVVKNPLYTNRATLLHYNNDQGYSELTLKRMSESHKNQIPWNVGISPSIETRKRISVSMKEKNKSRPPRIPWNKGLKTGFHGTK
jgi:hypothetical protein